MKIAVLSDLHVKARFSLQALFDKRIVGFFNASILRARYDMARIDDGIRTILAEKPDLILFGGDAVSTADPREFRDAARRLRPLIESGIPILYTPGNHDRYVRAADCVRAWRKFRDMLDATVRFSAPGVYETDELRFITIDSADPCAPWMSCGVVKQDTPDLVKRLADSVDSRPLVLLTHFPCWSGNGKTLFGYRHGLHGYENLQRVVLGSSRIPLIVAGHRHSPHEVKITENCYEIVVGSLTKYDVMCRILFQDGKFTIETINSHGAILRPSFTFRMN